MERRQRKSGLLAASAFGTAIGAVMFCGTTQAAITAGYVALSGGTDFPSTSANGAPLVYDDIDNAAGAPSGYTLAGGSGVMSPAGGGIGETFTGVSGNLDAVSFIQNGAGGGDSYIPFLYNLGTTGPYNSGAVTFNPTTQTNLISAATLSPGPSGTQQSYEIDFSGSDVVTLNPADYYAFGLDNSSGTPAIYFEKTSGGATDPNDLGFTISSPYASGTESSSPFAGSPRNLFAAMYTTAVPEPASLGLLGVGGLALVRRRARRG